MDIEEAIQIHGANAEYIGQVAYDSMTPEGKNRLYREALEDDPAVP